MRIVLMAAALAALAGCATEAEREASRAHQIYAQRAYTTSQAGGASETCKTKVQFAMAGYQDRTFLGLEGMARGNQLHAQCLEYWRRTGQMP